MLRRINCQSRTKLMELSLKQREQLFAYHTDKEARESPGLSVAIPPRMQHEEEPNSPSRQVRKMA
jgi:hypothetical protein